MDDKDQAWIRARYDARLEQFGDDIRTLGSGTEERRRMRFDILRQVGITSGSSVLDVGCGFGDFHAFLASQSIAAEYFGVDINPKLVEIAAKKHPQARFATLDFLAAEVPAVDFVVASGTFNLALRATDNYDYLGRVLRRAYGLARKGVAIDLHTSYVDYRVADVFYYEPERVFAIAKAITRRVTLRHDYPLFEFCIYLFPDFAGWNQPTGAPR